MKQLLTLTSLFFILSANAQSIIYTIKDGDTLYSIAKDNNISINKIFKANEELGFSPDEIYSGNTIYLPQKKIHKYYDICYSSIGETEFSLYKSTKEITKECLEQLYPLVEVDKLDPNNLSDEERLFIVNYFMNAYVNEDDSRVINEYNLLGLLDKAAELGDTKAAFNIRAIDVDIFFNNINNQYARNIINHELAFEERKNSCIQYLKNEFYDDYDLNIFFYLECADTLFDEGDNDYIKFDNELNEIIFSTNSQIIKIFELYAINSQAYRRLNSNNIKGALDLTSRFVALKCPDCENSSYLVAKYINSLDDDMPYSTYHIEEAMYYLLLNDTNAGYSSHSYTPEQIIENRNYIISFIKDRLENVEEDNFDFRPTYTAFNSDTAVQLIDRRRCELSKDYLDLAIIEYQSDYYDNSNQDYFIEPLKLSICYINKFLYNFTEYENTEKANAMLNSSKYYLDIALKAKEELDVVNPIMLSLLNIQKIILSIWEKSINNPTDIYDSNLNIYLSDELTNELYNLSSVLNQQDIYDFSGDIEDYELLSSTYISLHHHLYLFRWPDIDKIIDPVTLLKMKDRFFVNSKLINLKVENANLGLKEMQIKLVENNKRIKESSNQEKDYKEMLKLYKENADLIEQIFSLNKNLEMLTIGNRESMQSIQSSLNENEFAYFYVPSKISSQIILISNSGYEYWNGPPYHLIKPIIDHFISSINPNEEYYFKAAQFIGKALFPMFYESDNDFLKKDATIFIYTDNLIGLPPGILVKSYNDSPEISEYERLITAEWFINDYNFTTRLNYENNSDDSFEKRPFLGIGNSTSYDWVGLPNLNEVNSEITNLALTSFGTKDDILLGKQATKEFFLDKLENDYERIVISTHSVPPDWQGLIEEPALVFNSKFGDYFLTPTEIINKNFNNDMVVLSSCNASIQGFDELYKSFLIAGSKSVVHSNWNLESRYAREFTTNFFKELWLKDQKKHEAIRNVSLNFLNDYSNQVYAHPAYWGNFSIVYSSIN